MISIDADKCTACGACVQKCPKRCISLKPNKDGFLYPNVDITGCVNCNITVNFCGKECFGIFIVVTYTCENNFKLSGAKSIGGIILIFE